MKNNFVKLEPRNNIVEKMENIEPVSENYLIDLMEEIQEKGMYFVILIKHLARNLQNQI